MKRFLINGAAFAAFALGGAFAFGAESAPTLIPYGTAVEYQSAPVGVDCAAPRLSWKAKAASDGRYNQTQSAFRVLVASTPEKLAADEGDLWDSGKVDDATAFNVEYAGAPLKSFQRCYWKVRVWDGDGVESDWSEPARWIQGVASVDDWKGDWIAQPESVRPNVDLSAASWIASATEKEAGAGYAVEYFRREFVIDRPQSDFDEQNLAGTLYYAANQKFEIFVNGQKVGYSIGMVFNPDQLRSIDVSEYLTAGKNVVAFAVSNDTKNDNGTKFGNGVLQPTALIAKLDVRTLDKTNAPANLPTPNRFGVPTDVVCSVSTDASWKASLESPQNWNAVDFDASAWADAAVKFAGADDSPWGKLRRRTETVSPNFQKTFDVAKDVKEATLVVCAPGLFEARIDGEKIGDQVLTPAFTRYDRRCLYNVFDVTDRFKNADAKTRELELTLGHSWYDVRSIVTWNFDAAPWRDFPRVRAQLELTYEDGTSETIATDPTWTYSTSPVLFDCVRQGEIVDGNYDRQILGNAVAVSGPVPNEKLVAQKVALSKATETFPAKSVKEVKPGVWVVDMGRDTAGWARIKIRGQKKGDVLRFKYSERVVESGEIERRDIEMHFMEGTPAYLTGMKGGFQTDFYFCNGDEEEIFEPRFTYNGFMYVEVVGLREAPKPEDFEAVVINTDFASNGSFECSNELLNKIQAATLASYRNNYVAGYPTDCPHREKNGWTGDAQLACELAQYNWENTVGYEKWIDDLCDEQKPDGNLPGIVPSGDWGYPWGNGPAWDSSLVLIPWYLYVYRGDKRVLETAYESMKKYVDYMTTRELENGLVGHGLGDWVPVKTVTPTEVTSTGYYFVDAKIVAQTAKILGKTGDFVKYSNLADKIRKSYNDVLYKGDGVYSIGSQTAQSCAIHQGFASALSDDDQQAVYAKLADAAANANGGRLDVGIFGTKYIFRTLSEGGRNDLALTLLLQEGRPSYADWIRSGTGTLWEDWGDGSSRNHIMFGDVSAWFYQSLAGIKLQGAPEAVVANFDPESVAFKNIVIDPKCKPSELAPNGFAPLTSAAATVESVYGTIKSAWAWNDDFSELTLNVEIPVNATATVFVPCEVGTQKCDVVKGADAAKFVAVVGGVAVYEVGSGAYTFETSANK